MSEVVLFVPKNAYGGYNCSVELQKTDGGGCRVFLRPASASNYVNEDDLQLLMGLDKIKRYPFEHNGVRIEKMFVPEYELRLSKSRRPLNFDEAVAYMSKVNTFELVR